MVASRIRLLPMIEVGNERPSRGYIFGEAQDRLYRIPVVPGFMRYTVTSRREL